MPVEPNDPAPREIPAGALGLWRVLVHAGPLDMRSMADTIAQAASLSLAEATRATLEAQTRGSAVLCRVHGELAEHIVHQLRARAIPADAESESQAR